MSEVGEIFTFYYVVIFFFCHIQVLPLKFKKKILETERERSGKV